MKFAVFTVMTPEWDLAAAADRIAQAGYDGVEWRVQRVDPTRAGEPPSFWGNNRATVPVDHIEEEAERVRQITRTAGLELAPLASYLNVAEFDQIQAVFRAAQRMGAPAVRVNVDHYDRTRRYQELYEETLVRLKPVVALARETGVKALVELHFGSICPSASLTYRLLSHFDPRDIGAIYDPGNMIAEGMENWRMGMELLGEYLAHVHVKNQIWHVDHIEPDGTFIWRYQAAPLREGIVNWREVLADLRAVGYDGWLSFEDFSTALPTEQKLAENLAYIRGLMG
jgi:sugar phosphate isomerase/epimerase